MPDILNDMRLDSYLKLVRLHDAKKSSASIARVMKIKQADVEYLTWRLDKNVRGYRVKLAAPVEPENLRDQRKPFSVGAKDDISRTFEQGATIQEISDVLKRNTVDVIDYLDRHIAWHFQHGSMEHLAASGIVRDRLKRRSQGKNRIRTNALFALRLGSASGGLWNEIGQSVKTKYRYEPLEDQFTVSSHKPEHDE